MKYKFMALLTTLLALATGGCGQQKYDNMDVEALAAFIADTQVQLLDVRTEAEYAEGHIDGASLADVKRDDFLSVAKAQLCKEQPVAVYCRSGKRSAKAAELLTAEGYRVTNLKGGIVAWTAKGMPTSQIQVDAFVTPGGKAVRLYALMHASIRIAFDGKEIQIDPVRQLGPRTTDYTAMPKADYIFVTHEHPDHFDQEAIRQLSTDGTQFVTNARCAEMMGSGRAMANGECLTLSDGITLEAVPAYNTTEGRTQFHPRGRDNGYILTLDGLRIYIAGDTEDIPEMAQIKDIDIAFLPCNQPYTMTPDQLLRAARMVGPRVIFPYHFGQTDVTAIPAALASDGIDVRLRHYE